MMEMMQIVKLEDIKASATSSYLMWAGSSYKYLTVNMRTGKIDEIPDTWDSYGPVNCGLVCVELTALRELGVSAPKCLIQMY